MIFSVQTLVVGWRMPLSVLAVVSIVLGLGGMGCVGAMSSKPVENAVPAIGSVKIAGTEMVYRFPNGRLYRARYAETAVSFELLEPRLEIQPAATFPYLHERVRTGLHLVVWDDPTFHTTLVIDLIEMRLHASSLPMGGESFLGSAEIVELRRVH